MSEAVRPLITYSPEDVLAVTVDVGRERNNWDDGEYDRHLERAATLPGFDVTMVKDIAQVEIDILGCLGEAFSDGDQRYINTFLAVLDCTLPTEWRQDGDPVLGMQLMGDTSRNNHHLEVRVFPHFQRWLNAKGTETAILKSCVEAMVVPMDDEVKELSEDIEAVKLDDGAMVAIPDIGVSASVRRLPFIVFEQIDQGSEVVEQTSRVGWNSPTLQANTLGCCCLDSIPESRAHIARNHERGLYRLEPHNVDSPAYTLSVLLGVARLAFYASQYDGTEDVFANLEVLERRQYPKL